MSISLGNVFEQSFQCFVEANFPGLSHGNRIGVGTHTCGVHLSVQQYCLNLSGYPNLEVTVRPQKHVHGRTFEHISL